MPTNSLKNLKTLLDIKDTKKVGIYKVIEALPNNQMRIERNGDILTAAGNYPVGVSVFVQNGIVTGQVVDSGSTFFV
jgi:hypothetical protein